MWTCDHCKVEVEPEFDVCWSCGASRDGDKMPGFDPEAEGIMAAAEYEAESEAKRRADLVTLATFWSAPEAHVVCTRLESEGIEAIVTDELATTSGLGLGNLTGGVRVEVPETQLTEARDIMESCRHSAAPEERLISQEVKEGIQTKPSPPVEMASEVDRIATPPTAEDLILASYRTAILSISVLLPVFLIIPVSGYSMYLLIRSLRSSGEVNAAAQRQFLIALMINLAFLLLWWVPLVGLIVYVLSRWLSV
jgi:hypothetical protein